jgi:hypothetical protein
MLIKRRKRRAHLNSQAFHSPQQPFTLSINTNIRLNRTQTQQLSRLADIAQPYLTLALVYPSQPSPIPTVDPALSRPDQPKSRIINFTQAKRDMRLRQAAGM